MKPERTQNTTAMNANAHPTVLSGFTLPNTIDLRNGSLATIAPAVRFPFFRIYDGVSQPMHQTPQLSVATQMSGARRGARTPSQYLANT